MRSIVDARELGELLMSKRSELKSCFMITFHKNYFNTSVLAIPVTNKSYYYEKAEL